MIGIIDTAAKNIGSIKNCLNFLKIKYDIVNKNNLKKFSHYILPGVGSFDLAIKSIKKKYKFDDIKRILKEKKILAICIGFQMLFNGSEEGKQNGLGLFNQKVRHLKKIDKSQVIPHVGFDTVKYNKKILGDFYFTHSFGVLYDKKKYSNSTKLFYSNFGKSKILTMIKHKNILATQFHPEKSGIPGLVFIKKFYGEKKINF